MSAKSERILDLEAELHNERQRLIFVEAKLKLARDNAEKDTQARIDEANTAAERKALDNIANGLIPVEHLKRLLKDANVSKVDGSSSTIFTAQVEHISSSYGQHEKIKSAIRDAILKGTGIKVESGGGGQSVDWTGITQNLLRLRNGGYTGNTSYIRSVI